MEEIKYSHFCFEIKKSKANHLTKCGTKFICIASRPDATLSNVSMDGNELVNFLFLLPSTAATNKFTQRKNDKNIFTIKIFVNDPVSTKFSIFLDRRGLNDIRSSL